MPDQTYSELLQILGKPPETVDGRIQAGWWRLALAHRKAKSGGWRDLPSDTEPETAA
jgi:hypothetical protein